MEKRYQVFISSTFADLELERKSVMEAILGLDCFPAGMEMFPASDTEQFEYIKTIIDQSDYYVLIIAGRYGSVAEDGMSYTEKEYDYAKSKGIPILSFIKENISTISVDKTDEDSEKKKKLMDFRKKAFEGRLGKYWNSSEELKYLINSSLSREFKVHPRRGWIQGDKDNNEILLSQINELRVENERLKNEIVQLKNIKIEYKDEKEKYIETLAQGDCEYDIGYRILKFSYDEIEPISENNYITFTWDELFHAIGDIMISLTSYKATKDIITEIVLDKVVETNFYDYSDVQGFNVNEKDLNIILLQLTNLDLIEQNTKEVYLLTDRGREKILDKLLIKKSLKN